MMNEQQKLKINIFDIFRVRRENAASIGCDEKGMIKARKSFWKSEI